MTLQTILPGGHFEVMKAKDIDVAINYCFKADSKVEGPWEYGTRPVPSQQGRRTDLVRLHSSIMEGGSMETLLGSGDSTMVTTCLQYPKAVRLVEAIAHKRRRIALVRNRIRDGRPPMVPPAALWMVGPTGVRKTSTVMSHHGLETLYSPLVSSDGKLLWWDNYQSQKILLLDEFDSRSLPISVLLQILDGNPLLQLPVKGGSTYVEFTNVYIIQNQQDSYCEAAPRVLDALFRRVRPVAVETAEDVVAEVTGLDIVPTQLSETT